MKLIKLNKEHYIIVDGFEVKEGDFMYDIDGDIGIAIGEDKSQWEGNMKIIYSFGKKIDGVINKPLSEVEELLFGYSAQKLAESRWNEATANLKLDTLNKGMWCGGFQHGFNAHKELTKDKLFTVKDLEKTLKELSKKFFMNPNFTLLDAVNESIKIIDLLQPTEWEVEFINGKLTLKQ